MAILGYILLVIIVLAVIFGIVLFAASASSMARYSRIRKM